MSALEEYEKLASGKGPDVDPDDIFDYADAAIESLKCCGNCKHCLSDYEHGQWSLECGEQHGLWIAPGQACHFTPSRWKERV